MVRADRLSEGQPITLAEMLQAREQRVVRQQRLLALYRQPLVSFTLVAPGPVKNSPAWRDVAEAACKAVLALCQRYDWNIEGIAECTANSGPEWMIAVCAPSLRLKEVLVELERTHPLGRLWDLDVINETGTAISRRELDLPGRRCLICENDAHLCARARTHSLEMLLDEVARRIESYERNNDD